MDKEFYDIMMKQANGSLMTALENQIQSDIGGTRKKANIVANHILDILDAHEQYKENNAELHEDENGFSDYWEEN